MARRKAVVTCFGVLSHRGAEENHEQPQSGWSATWSNLGPSEHKTLAMTTRSRLCKLQMRD